MSKKSKTSRLRHTAWVKKNAPEMYPEPKLIGNLQEIMDAVNERKKNERLIRP